MSDEKEVADFQQQENARRIQESRAGDEPVQPASDAREWMRKNWEELTGDDSWTFGMQHALEAYALHCRKLDAERIRELEAEVAKSESRRKHTQDWYTRHYGKLHDWARKRLPENWKHEFFCCIANGTWHWSEDVGEPYTTVSGHRIVPTNYFKMGAQEQMLHDQTDRAERAEVEVEGMRKIINDQKHELVAQDDAKAEVARLQQEIDSLLLQAQSHAREARTANATIHEIYQLISGGKGEHGNWHGAEPVREYIAKRDRDIAAKARQAAEEVFAMPKRVTQEQLVAIIARIYETKENK